MSNTTKLCSCCMCTPQGRTAAPIDSGVYDIQHVVTATLWSQVYVAVQRGAAPEIFDAPQPDANGANLTKLVCVQVQQGGAALSTRRPGQQFWRCRAPRLATSPGQGGCGRCRAAGSCYTAVPVKKATASTSATAASSTWLSLRAHDRARGRHQPSTVLSVSKLSASQWQLAIDRRLLYADCGRQSKRIDRS